MNLETPIQQEPSLLEIFRSQYSNYVFSFVGETFIPKTNTFDKAEHFIHQHAPALIECFLSNWQADGLLPHISQELLTRNIFLPLDLLSMAQALFLRFTQIIQYLQIVRRTYLLKLDKIRGKKISSQKGVHLDNIASGSILKEMYPDWETVDDKTRADRKARFRRENRQARRWLFLASKISLGILIIGSPELEKEVNSYRTSDFQLIALAKLIMNDFPGVVEMYKQLDTISEGLLNLERSICSDIDSDLIAAQVAKFLHTNRSTRDDDIYPNPDSYQYNISVPSPGGTGIEPAYARGDLAG